MLRMQRRTRRDIFWVLVMDMKWSNAACSMGFFFIWFWIYVREGQRKRIVFFPWVSANYRVLLGHLEATDANWLQV